jgi:hypothetical protein
MQTLKQWHAPFLPSLVAWIGHRVLSVLASMKPQHRAAAIAAITVRRAIPRVHE